MIHISYPVLFIICFGCLSFGACIGMTIMALCRISGEQSREEELRDQASCRAGNPHCDPGQAAD